MSKEEKEQAAKKEQEEKQAALDAAAKRKEQSGMLTTLKKSSKHGAKQLLDEYQKLSRFDDEKTALLARYQKDKSLKWVSEYFETKTESLKSTRDAVSGFCTECFLFRGNI